MFCLGPANPVCGADSRELALRHHRLELPGIPSAIVPADIDADGRKDLLVVLVYTAWDEIGTESSEGLVQMTSVIPALFERREMRVYLARPDGSYEQAGQPMALPESVLSVEAGPRGLPAVALTDDGVAAVRITTGPSGPAVTLEPLLNDPPVLAGTGVFLSGLGVIQDLDGRGDLDLLLPAKDGMAIYPTSAGALPAAASARLAIPGDTRGSSATAWRRYPLARAEDLDGDHRPDLLVISRGRRDREIHVMRGSGDGHFQPPREVSLDCLDRSDTTGGNSELAFFGDLDGDGRAEVVTRSEVESEDDGLKEAKNPKQIYRFHRLKDDFTVVTTPYQEVNVVGYAFGGGWPMPSGSEFRDLDGDGRKDLVTVTLDFSILQAFRVLATKKIGMGLIFHIWAQDSRGGFHEVPDLDLSEKLLLDFNDLKLDRAAQFSGDFDGDGLLDFTHLGRGKTVTIHRGRPGCLYEKRADLTVELDEEPRDLALVRIQDLDGDGRSDLMIFRPLPAQDPPATAPVGIDLYLSGELK
ncbi:MAG TPA: VCBS repeat-containing protein [Candidatus Polarisedimenticolia bacterium]|nr:VCBS repeat-containing protein [Candidatus Polarisedimenticolia bacterium]